VIDMLLGPHDIARRLEHQHRPEWVIWYGTQTRQYWAMARWVARPYAMVSAPTPEALDAAIAVFETVHPKPRHRRAHAVDH
jgi:hypothetical protein